MTDHDLGKIKAKIFRHVETSLSSQKFDAKVLTADYIKSKYANIPIKIVEEALGELVGESKLCVFDSDIKVYVPVEKVSHKNLTLYKLSQRANRWFVRYAAGFVLTGIALEFGIISSYSFQTKADILVSSVGLGVVWPTIFGMLIFYILNSIKSFYNIHVVPLKNTVAIDKTGLVIVLLSLFLTIIAYAISAYFLRLPFEVGAIVSVLVFGLTFAGILLSYVFRVKASSAKG